MDLSDKAMQLKPAGMSPEEWATRLELAACYRAFDWLGWTELIYNHITLRVPGPEKHYLINPYGLWYTEVTASNLVKVNLAGEVVDVDGVEQLEAHRVARALGTGLHAGVAVGHGADADERAHLLVGHQHAVGVGDEDALAAVGVARHHLHDRAADATALIDVVYEPLRTFATPEESLAHAEPRIHEYGDDGNIHKAVAMQFGDVDAAIAGADHVFEDTFFYEGNTHLALEQHATVALKDPEGKLVVHSSTQTPHYLHRALAKTLGLPAAHIRVIATPNGGGFGGKSDPFNHEIVVAKADVSDAAAMARVVDDAERQFGRIDGVFHTAGVPGGGAIQPAADCTVQTMATASSTAAMAAIQEPPSASRCAEAKPSWR